MAKKQSWLARLFGWGKKEEPPQPSGDVEQPSGSGRPRRRPHPRRGRPPSRPRPHPPGRSPPRPPLLFDLEDGDEVERGNTVFRVGLFVPTVCSGCGAEIAEDQKAAAQGPGGFLCSACRARAARQARVADAPSTPAPPKKLKVCAVCGQDVAGEVGEHRQAEYVCSRCQADPARIAQDLLGR